MSAATPNFFAVLSDDSAPAVGSNAVHLEGTPKTVSSTSSKKADVNPKADPARARPRAPGAPSNDRTSKESKNAGRSNNRAVPVREGAPAHHSRRHEHNDRSSRSGKRDTAKRTRSGWGDEKAEPKEQAAGEESAQEQERDEAAEDAEDAAALASAHAAPRAPKSTLDEYMQQQRAQAEASNTRKPKTAAHDAAQAAQAATDAGAASQPEPRKKHSNKPRKEVETLELDASVAPPSSRQNDRRDRTSEHRPTRGDKPNRGEKRGAKPGAKGAKGKAPSGKKAAGPKIDLKALPTLK